MGWDPRGDKLAKNVIKLRPGPRDGISTRFLDMIGGMVALGAVMYIFPEAARWLVFPFVLLGWLVSLCLHEFGHAYAALRFGDTTVRGKGYLTLDPLLYTDAQFSILMPMVFLALGGLGLPGGAVYLDTWHMKAWQRAWISAAGPIATAGVLVVLLIIMAIIPGLATRPVLWASLSALAMLQVSALLYNLLPVPGLDGYGIIEQWLPITWRETGRRMMPIGPMLLALVFIALPVVGSQFYTAVYATSKAVGIDPRLIGMGLRMFQFWRF